QVSAFLVEYFLDFLLQPIFLCADFGAEREERTTEHTAEFSFAFDLKLVAVIAISPKSFQGWKRGRKQRIEFMPSFLPLPVDRCRCQVGFRVKEIIKATLFDPRLLADLVYGSAPIRAGPDQFPDGFHQSLFGITDATHKTIRSSIPRPPLQRTAPNL